MRPTTSFKNLLIAIITFSMSFLAGGPLSCQLYNLYLGDWEQLYLKQYIDDDTGLFIRNCDDCLYITEDHAKASSYLRLLEEGFPDYNLHVNLQKTETNIRDESKITVAFGSYTLNLRSFQIHGCYDFCRDLSIFHSTKLSSIQSPGKIILKCLNRPCLLKLGKVFLDTTYNTVHTVLQNVFMAAYVTAAKSLAFMERLFSHFNDQFVMTCLKNCARSISRVVHNSLVSKDAIHENMLQWMVIKAFQIRLKAKKLKVFLGIMSHIQIFLRTLLKLLNEQQQKVISPFFCIKQPNLFRSLI